MSEEKKIRMVKMTEENFNVMINELMKCPASMVGGLLFQWLPSRTIVFEEIVVEPKVEELPNNVLPFVKPEEVKEDKKEE